MKNPLTIAALCLLAVIIFIKTGVANTLLMFLLVGAVPGTMYNISPAFMLLIFVTIMWLVLLHFTGIDARQIRPKTHTDYKKRMPKKRFEQV